MDAAIRGRRTELRVELDFCQIVRTVQHPNVVVAVDGQAGDAAHLPLVGKRLGPAGVELVLQCGGRLCSQRHIQDQR